ncbi:unnamed protein product, partial [Prorocentrum cordatum]
AAEKSMEFLGEAADRVQEEVRRLEAHKEQSVPRCFTQAQVEQERRRAETSRDRIKKRIEALNAKAEDIQKELAEEQSKLEKKESHVRQLEAKRSQLEQHTVPTDAAEALLHEHTKETADTDLKAKHKHIKEALAMVKKRQQAIAEEMEKTKTEAEAQRSRSVSRKRGAESSSSLVAIPARTSPEQIKQLLSKHCTAEQQHVTTAHASTAKSLERVMGLASTEAVVVGRQLSMGMADSGEWLQRMARKGWRTAAVPSVRTADGGWSAGTATAVPRHIATSFVGGPRRLAVAWVDLGERGGIVMGPCYLWHSGGPAPGNLAALAAFGALMDATGMQWVIGGDLDSGPEQLHESRVIDGLKGVIIRPSEGTCKVPKREASTRDYFIASRRLAQTEHATVEKDLAIAYTSPSRVGWARVPRHTRRSTRTGNRYHCFAGGDLARRQGHFQTEQVWEVMLAPARKSPRGAPTKRAATAEWLRYRVQELARSATGTSGDICHTWQKQLELNEAEQVVINMDLLPLTAVEEGAPRARPDGTAADDWQNTKWAITNLGNANIEKWALKAGEVADQERRAAITKVCQHCVGFKRQTALGAEQWLGGAEGIERIIDMLDAVEDGEPWPSSQSDILLYNIPRAEGGGMRCPGLLPEVVRLWEKRKRPIMAKWEACHRRDHDWSRAGRSSERGAWMQQRSCEATAAGNESYAIASLGLVRCFEYVGHWK